MDNLFWVIVTASETVLTLVNIFQWFDKRSKNKALQSFLEAAHDMSKRLSNISERSAIQEKSSDICAVLNAAIVTVSGRESQIKEDILVEKIYSLKNKKSKKEGFEVENKKGKN